MSNHINYPNNKGNIYCRKVNRVININNLDQCMKCSYRNGSAQGMGIECEWEDEPGPGVRHVTDPTRELMRVSQLIGSEDFDTLVKP